MLRFSMLNPFPAFLYNISSYKMWHALLPPSSVYIYPCRLFVLFLPPWSPMPTATVATLFPSSLAPSTSTSDSLSGYSPAPQRSKGHQGNTIPLCYSMNALARHWHAEVLPAELNNCHVIYKLLLLYVAVYIKSDAHVLCASSFLDT